MPPISDSASSNSLTVVLIAPNAARRRALAAALSGSRAAITREIKEYPSRSDLAMLAGLDCETVIVDLDEDVEQAMRVIENIGSLNAAMTVMAYSSRHDETLMRRSMQAGAREFLAEPLLPETVREALSRASGRRPKQEKALGKMLVFAATKGGIGVTTIAANFAMALTKESGARVVVVDMDFQLGEIAVGFNMTPTFSVVDAFANAARLDRDLMATLLIHHSCGLAVLASPEEYNFHVPAGEGGDKVFRILREEFDFVVVDAGTCRGQIQQALFETADKL
jgi:pilus assembly protein CpaE